MDEQMQQQIVQLVQAAMSGDQLALALVQQIMLAAQLGDQQAALLAQMIQQVAQQMQQQQAQVAKFGAKLDYIKYLRGKCPQGYEMQAFKKGGKMCNTCVKKAEVGTLVEEKPKINTPRKFKKSCGGELKKK